MESQFRPGFGEAQGSTGDQPHAAGAPDPRPPLMPLRTTELFLRIVMAFLTLMSTIVMGTARETTDQFSISTYTIKSTNFPALVYFVVANAIAAFYSALSLAPSIVNKDGLSSMSLLLSIGDLLIVILLFSSNGAAAAISVVAGNGQRIFAEWVKICNYVDGFCSRINVAIVLSMFASMAYVVLMVLRMVAFRRSSS